MDPLWPLALENRGSPWALENRGSPLALENRGSPLALENRGSPLALENRGSPLALESRGSPLALESRGSPLALENRGSPLALESTCPYGRLMTAFERRLNLSARARGVPRGLGCLFSCIRRGFLTAECPWPGPGRFCLSEA